MKDAPGGWSQEAGYDVKQSGFSTSAWPEQRHEFASADLEVNPIERVHWQLSASCRKLLYDAFNGEVHTIRRSSSHSLTPTDETSFNYTHQCTHCKTDGADSRHPGNDIRSLQ